MIDNSENQLKTEVVIPEVSRTETSNEVFNLQKCIAKAEMPALKKGLSGLERYEVKVSRTVLRGGSDGNVTLLPGAQALRPRFDKLWAEECVQWRINARSLSALSLLTY
jgi:hypothetical protein